MASSSSTRKIVVECPPRDDRVYERSGSSSAVTKMEYNFDLHQGAKTAITKIYHHFAANGGPVADAAADDFALQSKATSKYIDDEFFCLPDVPEGDTLLLKIKPSLRAKTFVEAMEDDSKNKEAIFRLRYQLQDPTFAEEFIEQGGMDKLMNAVLTKEGNTQAYALTAVRFTMGYVSGLQEIMDNPAFIEMLFTLVDPKTVAPICRQAIELLFVLCSFDGFELVHRAARRTASAKGAEAYANVIALLASGDIETQVNSLTFVNSLLDNAPAKKQLKLLNLWKRLGIDTILQKQSRIVNPAFKTQLAMFEMNAGMHLATATEKPAKSKLPYKELEYQLQRYQEQQPLVHLLKQELRFYHNSVEQAIEKGSITSFRGPQQRHDIKKAEEAAPTQAPIDLTALTGKLSGKPTEPPPKPSTSSSSPSSKPTRLVVGGSRQKTADKQPDTEHVVEEVPSIKDKIHTEIASTQTDAVEPVKLIESPKPQEVVKPVVGEVACQTKSPHCKDNDCQTKPVRLYDSESQTLSLSPTEVVQVDGTPSAQPESQPTPVVLPQDVNSMQVEIEKLKTSLSESKEAMTSIKEEKEQLVLQLQRLESSFSESKETIVKLNNDREQLLKKQEELDIYISETKEISKLKEEKEQLISQQKTLDKTLSDTKEKLAQLSTEKEQLLSKQKQLDAVVADTKEQLLSKQKQLDNALYESKEAVEKLNKEKELLVAEQKKLEASATEQEKNLASQKTEQDRLNSALIEAREATTKIQTQNLELAEKIKALEAAKQESFERPPTPEKLIPRLPSLEDNTTQTDSEPLSPVTSIETPKATQVIELAAEIHPLKQPESDSFSQTERVQCTEISLQTEAEQVQTKIVAEVAETQTETQTEIKANAEDTTQTELKPNSEGQTQTDNKPNTEDTTQTELKQNSDGITQTKNKRSTENTTQTESEEKKHHKVHKRDFTMQTETIVMQSAEQTTQTEVTETEAKPAKRSHRSPSKGEKPEKTGQVEKIENEPKQEAATISPSTDSTEPTTGTPPPPPPPPPGGGPPPPPPPPGGAPPPPPPPGAPRPPGAPPAPGGGRAKQQFNKPQVQTKTKMRPLHWTRILLPLKAQDSQERKQSVWDAIAEPEINETQLVELFAVKKPASEPKADSAVAPESETHAAEAKKPQITRILPSKTSNAIAIIRNKMPPDTELLKALREMDQAKISKDTVRELQRNLPTTEEEGMIRELNGPDVIFDKPEQFVLLLSGMPNLRERLKTWEYMNEFQEKVDDVSPPLQTIRAAAKELKGSDAVKKLLGVILAFGNYLNGGNAQRGQADGFGIEIIPQLAELKDITNTSTLLTLAINTAKTHSLGEELVHVSDAAAVDMKAIESNLLKLAKDLQTASQAASSVPQDGTEDKFQELTKIFFDKANMAIEDAKNNLKAAQEEFLDVVEFFTVNKEQAATMTSDQFFGIFKLLIAQCKKAAPPPAKISLTAKKAKMASGAFGARLGDSEDPMGDIIASIRSGQPKTKPVMKTGPPQPVIPVGPAFGPGMLRKTKK